VKHTAFKLAIPLITIFVVTVPSLYGRNGDDYKVYDAVIRHMFRDGITQFDMNAEIDKIVIRDGTYSKYAYGPEKEHWDQVKIRLKAIRSRRPGWRCTASAAGKPLDRLS